MYQNPPSPDDELVPPKFARPVPRESLPAEFQSALAGLEKRYGAALRVNVVDARWAEVSVENIPAAMLTTQLQNERRMLFGAADPKMQVISPVRPIGQSIFLHYLTEPDWGNRAMMMSK
jgi:hypothetical protein